MHILARSGDLRYLGVSFSKCPSCFPLHREECKAPNHGCYHLSNKVISCVRKIFEHVLPYGVGSICLLKLFIQIHCDLAVKPMQADEVSESFVCSKASPTKAIPVQLQLPANDCCCVT